MTGYAGAVEKGCSRRPICRGLACRFNWTGRGVSRAARGDAENAERSGGTGRPRHSRFLNVTW